MGGGGQCRGQRRGQRRWLTASSSGTRQWSMVSARWGSNEATGVSIDVWLRRRWLDVVCSGVGGRLNSGDAGGGNGSGTIGKR
jgi:hypothetical protein